MTDDPLFLVKLETFHNDQCIDSKVHISGDFNASNVIKNGKVTIAVTHTAIDFDTAIKAVIDHDIKIKRHDLAIKVVAVLKECKIDYAGYLAERSLIIEAANQL